MKKLLFISMFVLAIIAISCTSGTQTEVQYKKHMSHNKVYEVDIPINYTQETAIGDLLAYTNERHHAFIVIDKLEDGKSLYQYAEEKHESNSKNKFSYNLFVETDSSCFYKVTRGTAMWSAYYLYMSKKLHGKDYVVYMTSDVLDKDEMVKMINHIYNSLIEHSDKIEVIDGKDAPKGKADNFATRNTNYYSIEYPKEWKVLTNVDQMTDAYIGASNDLLGFTIVFFDTDYSLSEINEESNSQMRKLDAKFSENKKITINGQQCFKSVFEYEMAGRKMKNISYVFKKGDTMYSVKFGSDPKEVNSNLALIEKIINTFHIK